MNPIENFKLAKYPKGSVTQWFGENPDLYQYFGLNGHNGIDIVSKHGTPLLAVEDCTVLQVKDNPDGYGKYVRLLSKEKEDGLNREWTYGHCDTISVHTGQEVQKGETIATMGNTGFTISDSTPYWKDNPYAGTHLHLGLRMIELGKGGWAYEGSKIKINVINYDNGYKGSVDCYPFLAGLSENETEIRKKYVTILSLLNKLKSLMFK